MSSTGRDKAFLGRLAATHHGAHLHLHLLELIHKLVLTSILDVAHLFANLLLQGSVAMRRDRLKLAIDNVKGRFRRI